MLQIVTKFKCKQKEEKKKGYNFLPINPEYGLCSFSNKCFTFMDSVDTDISDDEQFL
jgi:hypothetical protein